MKALVLIYTICTGLLMPCFAATESAPKAAATSVEKANQNRGPDFTKLTVPGVDKAEITAFGVAWRRANQNDNVIDARERLAEARKRLQEATGAEKKDAATAARAGADELRIEIRKAIQSADPKLKIETIEKLMDAVEDQFKGRMQEKKNSSATSGTNNS